MKFGAFEFDPRTGALTREGAALQLGHRSSELLKVLIANRGEIVGKEALLDAAWPGQTVEESNLTVQIAALRKTLGTTADGQDWIMTVPRVGYRFVGGSADPARADASKPVIAVLPFDNVSNDPEQEYFAQGLAEDLITDLSRVPGLMMIARNSSFAMRDRRGDLRGIGADLGARFIVDGSVRRAADKVRINAQLVEADDQSQLWAERFDGDVADVFTLQDQVVGRIVGALSRVLSIGTAPTDRRAHNVDAYDKFVHGRSIVLTSSRDGFLEGMQLLEQATKIDPGFAEPHAWLAMGHIHAALHWGSDPAERTPLAIASAHRAIALDPVNSEAFAQLGYALAFSDDLGQAEMAFDRALTISPSNADAMVLRAELEVIQGRPRRGVELVRAAVRLNPYPPTWYNWMLGFTCYADGDFEGAIEALHREAARRAPFGRILAASYAQLGRMDEAQRAAGTFLKVIPEFRISVWISAQRLRSELIANRFIDGYRKAGLPD